MSANELIHLGTVASIIGLPLTIGGFALALWQIRKTRSASESAKKAADAVRQQLLQMNAIQEIGAAIRALEDIRRLHRHKAWEALGDRYTSLKLILISVKGRTPNLREDQKTKIQATIQQLTTIEGQVESAVAGADEPEVDRINSVISKQIDRLGQVLVEIQTDVERMRQ
jgi:ribosomal protein S13